MVKQPKPYTVTFKKFEVSTKPNKTFTEDILGTLCFRGKRVLFFQTSRNGLGEFVVNTVIYNDKIANEIIDYQVSNGKESTLSPLDTFILEAATIHILKKEASKKIRDYVKTNESYNRFAVGAYVFLDNSETGNIHDYTINIVGDIYHDLSSDQIDDLIDDVKYEGLYSSYKEIYFMKYNKNNLVIIEKLK